MGELSAAEALQRDVDKLGLAYGTAFYHCCQELWRVSSNWDRYEALFGSEERVALLNNSSGNFWSVMQGVLHEYLLLGICRLTDPAGAGARQNLSVARLLEIDPTDSKEELARRASAAIEAAKFARTWRDKRISHNDLAHISGTANVIEPSTGLKVSAAIVAIHDVLNWVMGRYFDGSMFLIDLGDGDVNTLLVDLARARAVKEEERADLEAKRFDRLMNKRYNYPADDYGRSRRYSSQSDLPQPPAYTGKLPLDT